MCGIFGFNFEDRVLFNNMSQCLAHRGPDSTGYYFDDNIMLGHQRLSIIDLSERGKQPLFNEDRTIILSFNGEIYNFKGLRKDLEAQGHRFQSDTDSEVILHAYEAYGFDCLQKFNGIFAFCIYDTKKKLLFLARDSMGVKPLYYYSDICGNFIFASEIKAILQYDMPRNINMTALDAFFKYRYIFGKSTIFRNIFRLEKSTYAIFDLEKKDLKIIPYTLEYGIPDGHINKDIIEKLLLESVQMQLMTDVPLGVFLSGGLDSSMIVALIKKNQENSGGGNDALHTFSIDFEEGAPYNESSYSQQVSDLFSTNHHQFYLDMNFLDKMDTLLYQMDEPHGDPAIMPLYYLSHRSKKYITVALSGDGGDEVFGGYDQYRFLKIAHQLRHVPGFVKKSLAKLPNTIPDRMLNKFYKYSSEYKKEGFKKFEKLLCADTLQKRYDSVMSIFTDSEIDSLLLYGDHRGTKDKTKNKITPDMNVQEDTVSRDNDPRCVLTSGFSRATDVLNDCMVYEQNTLLAESYLMKTDKMTMLNAQECRVPLLDYRLVNCMNKMPSSQKIRFGTTKYLFKKIAVKYLPKEIVYRKKQGFHVPINRWLTRDVLNKYDFLFTPRYIRTQNVFGVDEILRLKSELKDRNLHSSRKFWNMLCFQIWYNQYFVNNS
ncbi:MAG: asparagine synthase (glutamine-hydrolyzing) [Candidatus Woesearchaeota archaeon]